MNFVAVKNIPATPETLKCDLHGEYQARYGLELMGKRMRHDTCPKCDEIETARRQREEAELESAAEKTRLIAAKRKAGLRDRHLDCSLENYNLTGIGQTKAHGIVSDYLAEVLSGSAACLILSGRVGTGKTHLAAAMINRHVEIGRKCQIVKLTDMIREIKSTWSKDSTQSETQVIDRFSSVPFLVIDEIGVQFGSDTEKLLISEIIDNRYQEMRPTVLISNLDAQGIKGVIGDRCYDRLREDGGKVVAFDWESHRGKAA